MMSDTLIIGLIAGTGAFLSVGLNVLWMGRIFGHLSSAIKDLTAHMNRQFDRIDKQFEKVDGRFQRIEGDLQQFYKISQ